MSLIPLNDAVFGEPVWRDDFGELRNELATLTHAFEASSGVAPVGGGRALTASLSESRAPHQIRVTSVADECREVQVGDLAILPEGGGTMVTVTRGGVAERLYMISERHILAVYRDDDA